MPEEVQTAQRQMPRYQCHKQVWALKIASFQHQPGTAAATMIPADAGYGPVELDDAFMSKHKPEVGGYYVVYDDGYKSYSPAKAFEEGYTRIDPNVLPSGRRCACGNDPCTCGGDPIGAG